jgi:hypothetical protein
VNERIASASHLPGTGRSWRGAYLATLAVLAVAGWWCARGFEPYAFNELTAGSLLGVLLPLFVIAVFLERALEVFIGTWRGIEQSQLEHTVRKARSRRNELRKAGAAADLALAESALATARYAFLAGLAGGIVISAVGVRCLYPLVHWDTEFVGGQRLVFNLVDIFLTGGLIGGGSEGLHQMISLLLDKTKASREQAQQQMESLRGDG